MRYYINRVKYLNELKKLGYPLNEILIIGGGTMALVGLKQNDDLDLWASEKIFKKMANDKNLKPVQKHGRLFYESKGGDIEISNTFPCLKGSIQEYLKRAIVVNGFYFKSVDDLLVWKKCMNRPKDRTHIQMIKKVYKSYERIK